jgi:hypothetical protein
MASPGSGVTLMRRREFVGLLGGAASSIALPLAARAQTNRVPRVGILSLNPVRSIYIGAFMQGLRDVGYVEGKNIIVEYRDSGQANHVGGQACHGGYRCHLYQRFGSNLLLAARPSA